MKKYILYLIFIITGCVNNTAIKNENNEILINLSSFKSTHKLNSKKLSINKLLKKPTNIFIYDTLLIVIDQKDDSIINFFEFNNLNLIKTMGHEGSGPNDFKDIRSLSYSLDNKSLFIFDGALQRIKVINMDSVKVNGYKSNYFINPPPILMPCQKIEYIDDSIFVAIGPSSFFFDKRIGIFSINNQIIDKFLDYPVKDIKKYPQQIVWQACESSLKVSPDKTKTVLFTFDFDRIDVIENHYFKTLFTILGPQNTEPNLKMFLERKSKERVFSYIDLFLTEKRIYALYCGKSIEEMIKIGAFAGEYIHIFDWNGNPLQRLELQRFITHFCVDEFNKKLYALEYDPEIELVVYDLNE